ncbi:MAG: stage 0 sporulation family protein [Anaerorhabdus sp.]
MSENQEFIYAVSVRFKNSTKAYSFGTNDVTIEYGDFVIVETVRGSELAEVVSSLYKVEEITIQAPLKPVVRKAGEEDKRRHEENIKLAKQALIQCEEEVEKLGLDMNLVSAEYTLDRTKILIVYVADERVDFRELLKKLASQLHCRIELKQIGSRDKAQLVGGVGMCGMEMCCSRYKKQFDVISINMAKNQLLALNVPKLSGQCGKLMCCLKYEDDQYKELRKGMPKANSQVVYQGSTYRVSSMNVIAQEVRLDNRDNSITVSFDEFKKHAEVKKVEQGKKREVKNESPEELSDD